uniref:Putative tick til 10 n=1 Tax=Amblyomma americanum TaxID=6943 RepID=A0A0C9SDS4_AMBAM
MSNMGTLGALLFVAVCCFFIQASGEPRSPQHPSAIAHRPQVGSSRFWPGPGPRPWPRPHFRRCPRPHEVYRKCVSSTCAEATCWKQKVGPSCTKDCASGCFCRKGFYRNQWGFCVGLRQCYAWGWQQGPWYPYPGGWYPYPGYGQSYKQQAVPFGGF